MIRNYVRSVIFFSFAGFTSCNSTKNSTYSQLNTEPKHPYKVYDTPKDLTWKALCRVFEFYTIAVANNERGILLTDWENQKSNPEIFAFISFKEKNNSPDRLPASILNRLPSDIKGRFGENNSRLKVFLTPLEKDPQKTKIEIQKELLTYNTLNGLFRTTASDQLEENAIFENISWVLKSHVLKTCNGRENLYLPEEECPQKKEEGHEVK
jgi:hypothetical protein